MSSTLVRKLNASAHPGTSLRSLLFRSLPSLSAAFLADRFLVPWGRTPGLDPADGLLEPVSYRGGHGLLRVQGKGPLIVLSHGWAGSGRQFAPLADSLVNVGFRVATFDAKAHGSAPGRTTNAGEFARLIVAVAERHGPVAGIVGHSLGGLASAMASETLRPQALALLAPMPSFEFALEGYQDALGFDDHLKERIARLVERRAETTRTQGRVERGLTGRDVLIVHDREDRRIPVQASRDLVALHQEVDYLETIGLGHSRLLKDDAVLDRITRFLLGSVRAHS